MKIKVIYLAACILLAVVFGVIADKADNMVFGWMSIGCMIIAAGVALFQLLFPYLLKLKQRALVVIPIAIVVALCVKKDTIQPEWVWYALIVFVCISIALIIIQPSTDRK